MESIVSSAAPSDATQNAPDTFSNDNNKIKNNQDEQNESALHDPNANLPILEDDSVKVNGETNNNATNDNNKSDFVRDGDDSDNDEETINRRRLTTQLFAEGGGIRLNWNHITYSVQVPDPANSNKLTKTKVIVDNISGNALPGRVLAIMSPSGGGKTSLVTAISGRLARDLSNSTLEGVVCLNDVVFVDKHKPLISYVCQDDLGYAKDTPVDAFRFSASMRNEALTDEQLDQRTQHMLQDLKLTTCKDTIMGVPGLLKGLSGGEKRRTNIGIELINNPGVFICDEITSGVDSVAAFRIGKLMRSLAHTEGRTVVCTIHSPSSALFALFDDLLLLAKGQVVYHGPGNGLRDYFDCIGLPMPENVNPVEFAMKHLQATGAELDDLITAWKRCAETLVPGIYNRIHTSCVDSFVEQQQHEEMAAKSVANDEKPSGHAVDVNVNNITSSSSPFVRVKNPMDPLFVERHGKAVARCIALPSAEIKEGATNTVLEKLLEMRQPPSALHQLKLLTGRSWRNVIRDPMLTFGRVGQTLVFSIFNGLLYVKLQGNSAGVQDREGVLFLLMMQNVLLTVLPAVMTFPPELAIFLQDQANKLYSPTAFYWAKTFVELPINTAIPFIFGTIIYFMAQLTLTAENYFSFLAITLACSYCANALGMLLSSFLGRKPEVALVMAPLIVMPMSFVAGLFANSERTGAGWMWLEWISFPRYVYKSYIRIEFADFGVICSKATDPTCKYPSGMDVVRFLGFDQYEFDKWGYNLLMLFVLQIVFRLLGMAGLYYQAMAQHSKLVFEDNYKKMSEVVAKSKGQGEKTK